jgi:hypothetical protein
MELIFEDFGNDAAEGFQRLESIRGKAESHKWKVLKLTIYPVRQARQDV